MTNYFRCLQIPIKTHFSRLAKTTADDAQVYDYISGTNLLSTITGTQSARSFTYDADGNVSRDGSRTLAYNQDNRLKQISEDKDELASYRYNIFGQRTYKSTPDGGIILYHYDLQGNLIAESDPLGNILRKYVYIGNHRLAVIESDPFQIEDVYFYINDHLGRAVKIMDFQGNPVWSADYMPFGRAYIDQNMIENHFRFPGQ